MYQISNSRATSRISGAELHIGQRSSRLGLGKIGKIFNHRYFAFPMICSNNPGADNRIVIQTMRIKQPA